MKGTFKITLAYLKELGACRDGQREFQKAFPDGGEYQEVLDRCAEENRLDLGSWLLDRVGPTEDVRVYEDKMNIPEKGIIFAGQIQFKANVVAKFIFSGRGIEAGYGIEAGEGIKASWGIKAGYSAKTVTLQQPAADKPVEATAETTRSIPAGQLAVGQDVTVNGNYYYSSHGAEPHGTFSGFRGKISRIVTTDPQRACPYHITTPAGGAMGWVKKEQIQA